MATSENDSETETGRLIAGRYRLENELGGGAMGTVWSGTDELLRRPVAVKEIRLPPGMPEEEAAELRERALREARAIAVVTHPGVVTLYDVAREDGEPYVVMELVPSQSLATLLHEHGALDDPQLALVTDSVAAALDAAHRAGIIHRDVKPGNVLIGDTGQVKLSDFGISRNIAEPTLTRTGIMLGTPAYIAPETVAGDPLTSAADLWGLGATLFAASEGVPPYDTEDDPLATITSVVHDDVPTPTRSGPIAEVISGLMVKDPAQRMALHEARRLVQPLLPESHSRPFDMLLDPEAPTLRVRKPAPPASTREEPESRPEPEAPALAADPGPLPFTPREPAPPRRSPWAVGALVVTAAVVFAVAAALAFLAGRTVAGQLIPASARPKPPAWGAPLVQQTDLARHRSESTGGQFTVLAPTGWTKFHSEREDKNADSKAVQFVSPDGRSRLLVQRFGGFFPDGHSIDDYLETLRDTNSRVIDNTPAGAPDASSGEPDRHLTYQTMDLGIGPQPQNPLNRITTAQLMPRRGDLWLLSVTTPGSDPRQAQALLNQILPGFAPQS